MNLTLDDNHVYRTGDRIVPGVTSILQDVDGVKPYWSEWHAQKGRAIHHAIHLYLNNRLEWSTVDDRIKPRIAAFKLFLVDTGYKVVESEMKLYSKRYNFAGTLDIWAQEPGVVRNQNIVLDIKPPSPEPIVELQLAAYSLILQENTGLKINRAAAVCLKDNGKYHMKWVDNLKQAQRVFLACLTVSNWQGSNQ